MPHTAPPAAGWGHWTCGNEPETSLHCPDHHLEVSLVAADLLCQYLYWQYCSVIHHLLRMLFEAVGREQLN